MCGKDCPAVINFWTRHGKYGWLSNFYRASFVLDGIKYRTVEHFYQAQKTTSPAEAAAIIASKTPGEAKWRGTTLRLRPGWEDQKVLVMLVALRAKFNQHPTLKRKLIATHPAILHEDSPTDMFWGKRGKDMLGKLLMKLRDSYLVPQWVAKP